MALTAAAHTNPDSALHAQPRMQRARASYDVLRPEEAARADMKGDDLFALMSALGWAVENLQTLPVLATERNRVPLARFADFNQASTVSLTHVGTGTVCT